MPGPREPKKSAPAINVAPLRQMPKLKSEKNPAGREAGAVKGARQSSNQ